MNRPETLAAELARGPNKDPERSVGMRSRFMLLAPLVTTSACVAAPDHAQFASTYPIFSPQAFFAGRTEGRGVLTSVLTNPRQVAVHGVGRVAPNGTITLEQSVEQEGSRPGDASGSYGPLERIGS